MLSDIQTLERIQSYLPKEKVDDFSISFNLNTKTIRPIKKAANSFITEQIDLTAKMLDKPFRQIAGLTKDWSFQELYEIRVKCEKWKCPPALWWTLYKQRKNKII